MSPTARLRWKAAGLVAFAAVCLAVVVRYVGYTEENLGFGAPYAVQAVLPDAGGLAVNADVRQAGLVVGKVKDIAVRAGNAVALLEIEDEHAPVYRDAEVLVREKTPVGERYVEIHPGRPTAGPLPSEAVLPLRQTREAVSVDQVLSTFDPATRRRLRRLLRGLGRGLDGRGEDLNRLLEGSAALVEEGGPAAQALREQRVQVARLVDDFGRSMRALGDRERDIRLLARGSKRAATAVATRAAHLGEALEELPPAVEQVEEATAGLASFSRLATPVLAELRGAFEELTPAVHQLRPAAARGRRTVSELGRFTREATPLLAELRSFSREAARSVGPLDRALGEYGPFIEYLAPYSKDFGAFFALMRSSSDMVVPPGNVLRVLFVLGEDSYTAARGEERAAYDALIETGLLSKLRDVGHNPYPAPGTIGNLEPFSGTYPRVEADD